MRIRRFMLDGEVARTAAAWAGDRTFCQPEFAELWRAKGGRPVAWVAREGDAPLAILPGVEFGHAPLVRFQSMPDGGYGGVLRSANVPPRPDVDRELVRAVARAGYLKAFIVDFYGSLAAFPGFRPSAARTTLVDLDSPSWIPQDRKLVSQARKAEREGIRVETLDWSRHGPAFLELVRITERRHGRRRPFYPDGFYRALAELAARSERIEWVMCEHDGRPACSHIYLRERQTLQGWQILYDKDFSFLKPNQYIRLTMCRAMAARGCRHLNLGGSPADAPGLTYFKRRWGGQPRTYPIYTRRSLLGRIL